MSDEKMLEALKDEGFVKKILEMKTQEEVQHAFKEKGVEVSKEEIGILGDIINKMKEKKSTNLSVEELDEIAGGGKGDDYLEGLRSPFKGGMDKAFEENSGKRNVAKMAGALTTTAGLAGGVLAAGATVGALGAKFGPKAVRWAKGKLGLGKKEDK